MAGSLGVSPMKRVRGNLMIDFFRSPSISFTVIRRHAWPVRQVSFAHHQATFPWGLQRSLNYAPCTFNPLPLLTGANRLAFGERTSRGSGWHRVESSSGL